MRSRLLFVWRCFRYVYDVIFFGMLAYMVQTAFIKEDPSVYVICYIAGACLLSSLLREFAPNNALLVAGHVLLVFLLIRVHGPAWIRVLTGLLIGAYLLPVSVAYVKRGCRPAPFSEPWPSILTVVLFYIGGLAAHKDAFANLAYGAAVLMMCDYFLIRYAQGLLPYMEQVTDMSGLPVRAAVSANSRIVAFLAVITGLFMAACRFLNLNYLVHWLASGLSWGISVLVTGIMIVFLFFLTLLTKNGAAISDTEIQEELNTYTAVYETSHAAEIIVEIFAILILIFLCCRLLAAAVRFLTAPRIEKNIAGHEEKKPQPIIRKEALSETGRPVERTNERQFRQAYRRMVLSYRNVISLNNRSTCEDIRAQIRDMGDGDADAATKLYEEVRYGYTVPGRKLIREMNRLAKQGRKR